MSNALAVMFTGFCCLLVVNALVVGSLLMAFLSRTPPATPATPALKLEAPIVDKEQALKNPLVCSYRCNFGLRVGLPPDGLCDIFLYQLESDETLMDLHKSLCFQHYMQPPAMKNGATQYGLAIFAKQARKSARELSTAKGIVEFLRLWTVGLHHFGLSFVTGSAKKLMEFDFGLLGKLRSLQDMIDHLTGKLYKRRYLVLGVQAWYSNFEAQKELLAQAIHNISITQPIDMLVLYTHIIDKLPPSLPNCTIAGPAIFENSVPLPLPSMLTTLELMQLADIPETISVLFSLQVGVSEFQMGGKAGTKTANYGDACWTRDIKPFEKSCGPQHIVDFVDKDLVLYAKPQGLSYQPPVLWDNITTLEMKINLVFGRAERTNFGWSLHRIEMDYLDNGHCTLPDGTPEPLIVSHVSSVMTKHRRIQWD